MGGVKLKFLLKSMEEVSKSDYWGKEITKMSVRLRDKRKIAEIIKVT